MKITAITRFKHGTIYRLLRELGWTQSELARRSGMCIGTIGKFVNLRRRPNQAQAEAIQLAFAQGEKFLDVLEEWPETFQGIDRGLSVEETRDIEPEQLQYMSQPQIEDIEDVSVPEPGASELEELDAQVYDELMERLPDHVKDMLKRHYVKGETLEHIGRHYKVTRERIRQIIGKAKVRAHKIRAEVEGKSNLQNLGLTLPKRSNEFVNVPFNKSLNTGTFSWTKTLSYILLECPKGHLTDLTKFKIQPSGYVGYVLGCSCLYGLNLRLDDFVPEPKPKRGKLRPYIRLEKPAVPPPKPKITPDPPRRQIIKPITWTSVRKTQTIDTDSGWCWAATANGNILLKCVFCGHVTDVTHYWIDTHNGLMCPHFLCFNCDRKETIRLLDYDLWFWKRNNETR